MIGLLQIQIAAAAANSQAYANFQVADGKHVLMRRQNPYVRTNARSTEGSVSAIVGDQEKERSTSHVSVSSDGTAWLENGHVAAKSTLENSISHSQSDLPEEMVKYPVQEFQTKEGVQGDRGESGPAGPPGPEGARGVRGHRANVSAANGPPGPPGPDGPRGDPGALGPRGVHGPSGHAGKQGNISKAQDERFNKLVKHLSILIAKSKEMDLQEVATLEQRLSRLKDYVNLLVSGVSKEKKEFEKVKRNARGTLLKLRKAQAKVNATRKNLTKVAKEKNNIEKAEGKLRDLILTVTQQQAQKQIRKIQA